jgi:NADPH2:quinone reductase
MKAVRIHEFGGVDVLRWEEVPVPRPRPHQVLIKVDSSGVNYADIMRRQGGYPGPDLPATLGLEAAGVIEEVTDLTVGQRVMGMGPQGNAEYVAVNANLVFPYPETTNPVQAGGMPIVFLTAYHLLKTRGQMQTGDTVLVQAGASGVGTVATQLAKAWGARVVTTASTQDKLDLSRSLGAEVAINYTTQDFEEEVKKLTDGKGVDLVLECVGGPVLEKSLRCVASYGRLISYGNASGTPASLPSSEFTSANRTIIGFSMGRSPAGMLDHKKAMAELFPMISSGQAHR